MMINECVLLFISIYLSNTFYCRGNCCVICFFLNAHACHIADNFPTQRTIMFFDNIVTDMYSHHKLRLTNEHSSEIRDV